MALTSVGAFDSEATPMTETTYQARTVYADRAVELLDDVQGVVRGYVFIWGSPNGENGVGRDSYETYFDAARPPNYSANGSLAGYPVCLEHGMDNANTQAIGAITRTWFDDVGLAFEAQLDKSDPRFQRTVMRVLNGEYKTSSSSADHMADFYEDGAFHSWMMTELSLVEHPSQAEIPPVQLVRSSAEGERDVHRDDASEDVPMTAAPLLEEIRMFNNQTPVTPVPAAPVPEAREDSVEQAVASLVEMYGVEAVQAVLAQLGQPAEDMPTMESAAEFPRSSDFVARMKAALVAHAQKSEIEKLKADVAAMRAAQNAAPVSDNARAVNGGNANISVSEPRKFWGRSTNDLLFAHQVINSNLFQSKRIRQSEEFLNVLAGRALDEVAANKNQFADPAVRSAMPRTTRANEVAISTAAGGGDEWVGIAYSTSLWEKARENRVYQDLVSRGMRVEEIGQGFESVYIPTEGADPTVYTIAQDADLASGRPDVNVGVTRIGTGRVLLTPGELGMAVAYSDVFDEDSLIRVAPQYNRQMEEKAQETIEQLFINGDTETSTTNINYDSGTPGTGLSTPYYIASNGALKYALVTGSSTSRDAGGLDENDYRETLKLMPSAIRTRKQQMVFLIDPDTHSASLDIAAIKTDDVRRTNATITSGMLTNIYGVDVLEEGFMLLAASDGKVTYNAAGTLGRILCVYAPFWAVATKRQVTVETDRDILSGTNIIVAKMRIGFMPRGAGAAVASYNVTV